MPRRTPAQAPLPVSDVAVPVQAAPRRTARQAIEEWEHKLSEIRDAWAQTLPPEAATEWEVALAYVRESDAISLGGLAADIQLSQTLSQLAHRKYFVPHDGVYFDVQSGTEVATRASFRLMFERAMAGGVKAVGVFVSERLFRSVEHATQYRRAFRRAGVELVYQGAYVGDPRTPTAWQVEISQDQSAEYHARNTGYYIGIHHEEMSRRGRVTGAVPEVWRAAERAPGFMGRKGSVVRWEVEEPLAGVLQEGLRRYLGGMSFTEVAAWGATTELSGVTPGGRVMDADWWYAQLTNPRMAGYQMPSQYQGFKPGKIAPARPRRNKHSELVPCVLPALWTLDDYRTVLKLCEARSMGPKHRRTYRPYLLSGIAWDRDCGHRMSVVGSPNVNGHFWMRCEARDANGKHAIAIRADVAEAELDELMSKVSFTDTALLRQVEEELRILAAAESQNRDRFRADPAIAQARQALAALGPNGFDVVRRQLEADLVELEHADDERREENAQPLVNFRRALRRLEHWGEVWANADGFQKNDLLRAAGLRVVLGRLPGEKKPKPARILSIECDDPAMELALASALDSADSLVSRTPNNPMSTIRLAVRGEFLLRMLDADDAVLGLPRMAFQSQPWRQHIPPEAPGGPWLTSAEFARRVGRPDDTVAKWLKTSKLHSVRVSRGGKVWCLIHADEVDRVRAAGRDVLSPYDGRWGLQPDAHLTVREFAWAVGVCPTTVQNWIHAGKLVPITIIRRGRPCWVIPEAEVSRLRGVDETAA